MEPTYFLYAGKLFHDAVAAPLDDLAPDTIRDPRSRWELMPGSEHDVRHDGDPAPAGPESEPVGDDEPQGAGEEADEDEGVESSERAPASQMPMIPQHPTPDANPIDPRVF